MKWIVWISMIGMMVWADGIKPFATLTTDGYVSDMVVREGKIYVASDNGIINCFDVKSQRKLSSIYLPKVTDAKGKIFAPKIYSLDHFQGTTVVVSESGRDFRNVYLIRDGKVSKLIDTSQRLMIKKIRFLDLGHVLFALSGDTIIGMDVVRKTFDYQVQAGGGVFSDMELSPSKALVAIGDEGGEIMMLETKKGRHVKTMRGINLDAITRLSYQQNTILSGGHDRRVGVYRAGGSYFIETSFFVYAVGLSPLAKKGVYTDGEENELQVFDIETRARGVRLYGGEIIIDRLIFINENLLIGTGEQNKIYYWRIP